MLLVEYRARDLDRNSIQSQFIVPSWAPRTIYSKLGYVLHGHGAKTLGTTAAYTSYQLLSHIHTFTLTLWQSHSHIHIHTFTLTLPSDTLTQLIDDANLSVVFFNHREWFNESTVWIVGEAMTKMCCLVLGLPGVTGLVTTKLLKFYKNKKCVNTSTSAHNIISGYLFS